MRVPSNRETHPVRLSAHARSISVTDEMAATSGTWRQIDRFRNHRSWCPGCSSRMTARAFRSAVVAGQAKPFPEMRRSTSISTETIVGGERDALNEVAQPLDYQHQPRAGQSDRGGHERDMHHFGKFLPDMGRTLP